MFTPSDSLVVDLKTKLNNTHYTTAYDHLINCDMTRLSLQVNSTHSKDLTSSLITFPSLLLLQLEAFKASY